MENSENSSVAMNRLSRHSNPPQIKEDESHEKDKRFCRFRAEKRPRQDTRDNSSGSSLSSRGSHKRTKERETDVSILARRQKQIDYGKNTTAYDNYIKQISKKERAFNLPRTPDKSGKYSRRQWDGLVKAWKLQVHGWNANTKESDKTFPKVGKWENDERDVTKSKSPRGSSLASCSRVVSEKVKVEEKKKEDEEKSSRSFSFNWYDDEPSDNE